MTYLLWQRSGDARIASPRLVLRAAEVAPLRQANDLCEQLAQLHRDAQQRIASATAEQVALGHAQGLEQGRHAAREEMAQSLLSLAQACERDREQLRRDIGALALQVVRKMLGQLDDDAVLAALAETAAREALPAQQLVLLVHPDLCEAVRKRLEAHAGAHDAPRIEVRGSPACARDACRIETEHGSIDASLEAQLTRLAEAWSAARVSE